MGDQPDRRRKPFPSWFPSWTSPSRASQRPRRQPQPPSITPQSPDSQEKTSFPATNEAQSAPLQPPPPPPPPPAQFPPLDGEEESLDGEAIMTRENLQDENFATEITEGNTKSVPESKQAESVAEESGETKSQALLNEQSIEEETEKDRSPDKTAITEKIAKEAKIVNEQSIEKETEKDRSPEEEEDETVNENQRKKTEPKLSITVLASKPSRRRHAREEESLRHTSKEKERKITISRTVDQEGMQNELKECLSKLVQKLSFGHQSKPGDEQGVSIITLASKNKGASMFICREDHRSRIPSIETSINSNVQGVNSSILNETDYRERNPGVHMSFSTKPAEIWSNGAKRESMATTQKASSMIITSPQKLSYEPRIRRRCLRGLLVEPSEEDVENSEKKLLHGCRFACDDKKKANGQK